MSQAMRSVHHHHNIGLNLLRFSGDGLHGNQLTTEVNHVGEVQHFGVGGDQIAVSIHKFDIRPRVFGNIGDFYDDSPSSGGLFKGFHHGAVVLVADNYFVAGLPTGAHDDNVQAFGGVSGQGDFVGQ